MEKVCRIAFRVAIVALLLAGALLFIFPFFWTVTTALKTYEQANAVPELANWLPKPPKWDNFLEAWRILPQPFHVFVLNTYVITVLVDARHGAVELHRRVRVRAVPVQGAQRALHAHAFDDDAAEAGDDDPGIRDVEQARHWWIPSCR